MKRVLVLAEDYPNNYGGVTLMYIHTRNLAYIKDNIEVTVINFRAKEPYNIDGIDVITEKEYNDSNKNYDVLILHAANIRNHLRFLLKNGKKFNRYIFFYHGHEVLFKNKVYPKPYNYIKRNIIKEKIENMYDIIKLKIWKYYLVRIKDKSEFVFVSDWMQNQFFKWVKIKRESISEKCHIIYNSVGEKFQIEIYDDKSEKEYDFITIRTYLDRSKYAIDIVNKLAKNTPSAKFLVIGKGEFFKINEKAKNIKWIDTTLTHDEIIKVLQKSKYALMPTRTDAQGLMMCEMAAFGIPVITSNIEVCHEIFDDFENAYLIDNNKDDNLNKFKNIRNFSKKDKRFFKCNTVLKEVELINEINKI